MTDRGHATSTQLEEELADIRRYEDFSTIALIAIVTDWLSDIKLGYCSTGWWLNQKFCCWEIESEDGSCSDWIDWSQVMHLGPDVYIVKWLFYIFVGLAMSVASNLSIGKEGPSVHMACCVGNVISRCFQKFRTSKAEMREILTASSAAGVAVAFGSPIGGVLFALEEMSSMFPNRTMWMSFFCAMIATMVLQAMNPFRTGKLVMFQVSYDRDWHFFEYLFVVIIGIFGGLYGALVIKFNLMVAQFRKKVLKDYPITEAAVLAFITALVAYPNVFLRIDMTEIMGILFRECEGAEGENYHGICQEDKVGWMVALLFLATILRTLGTIVSYGCKVPCGIFVPSMAIGATFGRMIGLLVKAWQAADPEFFLFASCKPDVPCITPGTYAFLGAAAALCGVMRITVSVVVIMFELTGQITYILPTMIALMITRAVGDWFGHGGIADRYIRLNGYPFLEKEDYAFGVPVSHVMQEDLIVMTAAGMQLQDIEHILKTTPYQGFPVARSMNDAHASTICRFKSTGEDPEVVTSMSDDEHVIQGSSDVLDFGPYMDQTPITVHPKLHLETVMDMFKKLGPRVVLLEQRGKVVGLVTVKDVLKYMAHMENNAPSREDNYDGCSQVMQHLRAWIHKRDDQHITYTRLTNHSSMDESESHELRGR
ncbi:chloride channel [Radiomyces spectabilis]|uniref:chloride channel n=1 Tax=Radiomyces spectabilis TaxID=64574 RepID=UPI0022207B2D|nr:chloride channel [Radiomyces spectabilis]KAI8391763.1 chloride channel [Radiomyces spectabilis]